MIQPGAIVNYNTHGKMRELGFFQHVNVVQGMYYNQQFKLK